MAKANLTLRDGTTVVIEGTVDEVASLLARFAGADPLLSRQTNSRKIPKAKRSQATPRRSTAKGPADYIRELAAEDYFRTKRGLGEVRAKLEEEAHIYPITTISPVMFRLVNSKELRRIKEDGQWKYVNA